jgi:hypothetical protein
MTLVNTLDPATAGPVQAAVWNDVPRPRPHLSPVSNRQEL